LPPSRPRYHLLALAATAAAAGLAAPPAPAAEPVAGAFVYPVGDELDFTKPHAGEPSGFTISDSYLEVRNGRHGQRTHKGVDLSCMRGGSPVRAIASGVVVVADAKAMIRTRHAVNVKVMRTVNGKRVPRWVTQYRTRTKWRTGWGNYIVIRHTLPDGQTYHSLYGHLQSGSILVRRGDEVAAGEMIARVGKTGRASSPHLHLEVRKAVRDDAAGDDFDPDDAESATVEDRTFALLATVDPIAFLERHVRRFEDLDPRSWQSRYALAASRDGIVAGMEDDRFDPDDAMKRGDFYAALASAFDLGPRRRATGGGTESFRSLREELARSGVLNGSSRDEDADDKLTRSQALEILLRCLDKSAARGTNLAKLERGPVCADFNRVFAGAEAAARAERDARTAAVAETAVRRKAAEAEYARAVKAQKAEAARGVRIRKRLKRPVVNPVKPSPRLDAGFEAVARSEENLTRAEGCLLIASAFRAGHDRRSALEQAASRVATAAAAAGP